MDVNKLRNGISKDLMAQLKSKDIRGKHYADLVQDYLALWDIKNKLIKDISINGIQVPGMHGAKSNPAIADLHRTNDRMLRTLDALGLKAVPVGLDNNKQYSSDDLI